MLGDNEAYLEKHTKAARTRNIDNQKLGPEFLEKEHTKPLFNNNETLTVHNLYNYHLLLGIGMILKSHTPITLYAMFKVSRRKPTLIIVPTQYTGWIICFESKYFVEHLANSTWGERY